MLCVFSLHLAKLITVNDKQYAKKQDNLVYRYNTVSCLHPTVVQVEQHVMLARTQQRQAYLFFIDLRH